MKLVIISVTRNRKGQAVRAARTIEGDSFAVGRATKCAVHLPDARVALEHATIYRSERVIRLSAVGSATLLVDGRPDPEAMLAPGTRVEVGPYVLTVETPPAGADLAIAIELLRPLADDLAEIRNRSRLSLAATGLAKRAPSWLLALIVLLLFLAIPIINASMPHATRDDLAARDHARPVVEARTARVGARRIRPRLQQVPRAAVRPRARPDVPRMPSEDPGSRADGEARGGAFRRDALRVVPRRPQRRRRPRAHRRRVVRRLPSRSQAARSGHEARRRVRFRPCAS